MTDPTEVWLPLNWYSTPGPLSDTTCGLSASRLGWFVTCWVFGTVVVGMPGFGTRGTTDVVVGTGGAAGLMVVVVVGGRAVVCRLCRSWSVGWWWSSSTGVAGGSSLSTTSMAAPALARPRWRPSGPSRRRLRVRRRSSRCDATQIGRDVLFSGRPGSRRIRHAASPHTPTRPRSHHHRPLSPASPQSSGSLYRVGSSVGRTRFPTMSMGSTLARPWPQLRVARLTGGHEPRCHDRAYAERRVR